MIFKRSQRHFVPSRPTELFLFVCLFWMRRLIFTKAEQHTSVKVLRDSIRTESYSYLLVLRPYLLTDIKIINWIINNLTHLGHNHRPRAGIIFLGNGHSALPWKMAVEDSTQLRLGSGSASAAPPPPWVGGLSLRCRQSWMGGGVSLHHFQQTLSFFLWLMGFHFLYKW